MHQLEYILIYILGTFAFAAYLVWLSFWLGAAAFTVLALVELVYVLLDLLAIMCVLVVVDRAEVRRLLPYVLIYGAYHAYLVRTVRLVAYLQEWVFVASRRDPYVPKRVADRTPSY